jgi:hypothetical protein
LEGFSVLFDCIGSLVYEGLKAFELEVANLFGGFDGELADEGCDQRPPIIEVPMLREGFVVLVFVISPFFGVFLNEPEHDAGRPFLGMEVVKFFGFPGLDILRVLVVFGVGGTDDRIEQHHPAAGDLFDFLRDLVVHRFPQKFDAQVDELGFGSPLQQSLQGGEGGLQKLNDLTNTSKK